MGFFSLFCGFMYNDFMSIPLELFKSCYKTVGDEVVEIEDCVYPFGLDYKWYSSHNELVFMNSLKMKMAVIFGVAQMLLGIFLKSLNAIYHNDFLEYLFEFWPQFILMWCWFGYMSILIITKWLTPYPDPSIAPSIVGTMIDMFLKAGAVEKDPLLFDKETNEKINVILLIISLCCIPLMLLIRPLHALLTYKKKYQVLDTSLHGTENILHTKQLAKRKDGFYEFQDEEDANENHEEDKDAIDREIKREDQKLQYTEFVRLHTKDKDKLLAEGSKEMDDEEDEFGNDLIKRRKTARQLEDEASRDQAMIQLSKSLKTEHGAHGLEEVFVHQLIETIEFVLGTVSNTASYLRLWALSLAHSQLASVFYEKTLEAGVEFENPIVLFFVQHGFWVVTLGVLMSMDSLE
jgi:V-type H+-transporting ATPase subunit a